MNIFVTGGAGYIGSATAQALIDAGHNVTVYDSLITGHQAAVPREAEFVQANLNDSQSLANVLTGQSFDAVMHFAAFIEAGESMRDPGRFFQNNVINSLQLIEFAHNCGVKLFVLSSTAAVYRASDEPLTEDAPIEPQNTYGQTKLMIEQTLKWYRQIHGLHYAALRYFNAAGATAERGEAHQPESHLIPRVLQVALGQTEDVKVFGGNYPTRDGTAVRDYIHISDLASAHVMTLEALQSKDRLVYNLGNGKGYSVREIIETAREVTGHPIPAVDAPRREGDAARLVASSMGS
ncbi:MAG: UDP-glucose 4-epimerase GalE [Chloroflexi bacterium]|nr:UDP-glucose 4-epimerase GalE [Chloroflexota bacterium]